MFGLFGSGAATSDPIWLPAARMRRIEPHFPLSHGVPRVDGRRAISGIIVVVGNGLSRRDASDPKGGVANARRTAASLLETGLVPRCIGRTNGGLNFKLHAVCDGKGRSPVMRGIESQTGDCKGAAMMLGALPPAKVLLGDRGCDAD